MVLFFISLIFISISSYFLSAILERQNTAKSFIYFVIISFSQIVLTTEVLSLFKQFKEVPFLVLNLLFFTVITLLWIKKGFPSCKFEYKEHFIRLKNSLTLDKSLLVLFFAWGFFMLVTLFLCSVSTVTDGDAKSYHVGRAAFWVLNSTVNHYPAIDVRALIFPINSEIVYSWIILFTKNLLFLGFLSFIFYFVYITSLYKIVHNLMGYSLRRTLWVVLIASSFAGVCAQISSNQTDLIIASLVTSSIYLFGSSFKDNKTVSIVMSSLCYALAIGTKTSAGFLIPAVLIFFIYLSLRYKNFKNLLKFLSFGFINFLVFSAYNYVLNYIDYQNIFGFGGALVSHKNIYGVKGFCANIIKHTFLMFDFTGFNWDNAIGNSILQIKEILLGSFNLQTIPDGVYSPSKYQKVLNSTLAEPLIGTGVLGFLLFIPCLVISFIKAFFVKSPKTEFNLQYALIFVLSLLTMSATLAYMVFNVRFLDTFVLICAPILTISYIKSNKNIFKWLIIFVASFYFIFVSTHIWSRPFNKIFPEFIKNPTKISELQNMMDCINWDSKLPNYDETCRVEALIEYNFNDKNNQILLLPNSVESTLRFVMMNLRGYHINISNIEDVSATNLDKYNILIMPNNWQYLNIYKTPIEKAKNENYKCMYKNVNFNITSADTADNNATYTSLCKFSDDFWRKYKFEKVMQFKDYSKNVDYTFYVNKRNLPHTNRMN